MMETFATAAAALSVAALFNNCVDCFQYIQLGRHFGRDFETCQLQLVVAQARLSRWGEAVAINHDDRFNDASPPEITVQLVQTILQKIDQLFRAAQTATERYEPSTDNDGLHAPNQAHGQLSRVVRERQKSVGLVKKATWALYHKQDFEGLIAQLTGFIDSLEKIHPAAPASLRQLAQLEIEEIDEAPALTAVRDAAAGVDDGVLAGEAGTKLLRIAAKNHGGEISTRDTARVRVGNEFVEAWGGRLAGVDETTNTAESIDAHGATRVHIGTTYGGRGIFDD